jgi:putative serine protease PepD
MPGPDFDSPTGAFPVPPRPSPPPSPWSAAGGSAGAAPPPTGAPLPTGAPVRPGGTAAPTGAGPTGAPAWHRPGPAGTGTGGDGTPGPGSPPWRRPAGSTGAVPGAGAGAGHGGRAGAGHGGRAGAGHGGGAGAGHGGGAGAYDQPLWRAGPAAGPAVPGSAAERRSVRGIVVAAVLAGVLAGGAGGAGVVALSGDGAAPRATAAAPARPAGSLAEVASRVLPSVVSVQVRTGSGGGTGSGFVLDGDGHVLTNAHVVEGATSVAVLDSTGATRRATVVGSDSASDLAVLRVTGDLPAATLGRSAGLAVGDPVLAVGSPLGLSGTVTAGIVSATDREVSFGDGRRAAAIQTDASINPGNSGGPLVDGSGAVVGVNTQIATLNRAGGNIGIGFAIPIDRAAQVADRLIAGS